MKSTQLRTPDLGENIIQSISYENTGTAPISVFDAKAWAKVDFSDDDTIMSDTIDEVIDTVENELNRTIVAKTVTVNYQRFASRIPLPFAPISSVTSVKTLDQGDETTLTGDDYRLQGNYLYLETLYQTTNPYLDVGLEVVYDAADANLPRGILLGLKKAILSNYEDRQDNVGGMNVVELPNSSWKHLKRHKRYD